MAGDSFEEAEKLFDQLETDDVGQKRYLMYRIFDLLLEKKYETKGKQLPGVEDRVEDLRTLDGYMYKLAQDFLTSSSTMEKENTLGKIIQHIQRT